LTFFVTVAKDADVTVQDMLTTGVIGVAAAVNAFAPQVKLGTGPPIVTCGPSALWASVMM
jgi:hypothetical protein